MTNTNHTRGIDRPCAKLTEDNVRLVRTRLLERTRLIQEAELLLAQSKLAARRAMYLAQKVSAYEFGVSENAIGQIERGETWRHIT
jgi:hypothetical protein